MRFERALKPYNANIHNTCQYLTDQKIGTQTNEIMRAAPAHCSYVSPFLLQEHTSMAVPHMNLSP